ncbi:Uncharacterized protein K02A2.6 [Stylophora pistillata]|uniref:Uncharacterized protein K02A2.6 n=1 Tax=Stylophora pistillata TaxID=50429 RepID=A0A2B4R938_STYPI|nr:Uncharacterized protein K02A2.6 [Stylophora pistillata]
MLVDSWATSNIVDDCTWEDLKAKKIKCKSQAAPVDKKLYAYASSKPLPVKGRFTCEVLVGKERVRTEFLLIRGKGIPLLSKDTAMRLGVLKIGVDIATITESKQTLQQKFPEVFSGIEKLKSKQVTLHIDQAVKPVAQPQRRIPLNLQDKVEKKVRELLKCDIIEEVDGSTPWLNQVVIVPKADGDLRLCIDMRQGNKAIIRGRYPIPTVDELLHNKNGSKFLGKLDLKWGYYQLDLSPESRQITNFVTHKGLYRYKRLLFGVSSASEEYQHKISTALAGIEGVDNISDDIIVHGTDKATHDQRLDKTMERLKQQGLTLNANKSLLNVDRVIFMVILLSAEGIGATEERVRALQETSEPATVSEQDKVESHPHGAEEYIRFEAISATPRELTKREVEEASAADEELKVLREAIKTGRFEKCKEYAPAAGELCVIGQLVLRGTRIVLPNKFRSQAISLAHEGHLGIVGTKQNLRSKVWWPRMDKAAEKFCKSCHGCQLVSRPDAPEPLRSTTLPEGPWQDLAVDLLGPLPSGHTILVVVDYYSRYYEYTIMTSTVTEKVIDNLEEIFSRDGLPLTIKSDNGPPFRSEEFREYCKKMRGKLPELHADYHLDLEIRDRDAEVKAKTRAYADKFMNAKPSDVQVDDQVLVRQEKRDKFSTPFNPVPFQVNHLPVTVVITVPETTAVPNQAISGSTPAAPSTLPSGPLNRITPSAEASAGNEYESTPASKNAAVDQATVPSMPTTPKGGRPQRQRRPPERYKDFVLKC